MANLKEQVQQRWLVGKLRRLEKENAELKALVETLQTWNESLKTKLRSHFTINAVSAEIDD